MTKYVAVALTALVLLLSGVFGLTRGGDPAPEVAAASDGGALPAAPGQDLTSVIAGLQERLRRVPGDAPSWAALGLAYVEQARVTGDPTYYGKADAVVARSLEEMPDDNAVAHASAAAVAAARHRFGTALREADTALAIDPRQPNALALRVDALTELGDYGQQREALRVADRRQPGVPVASRYSYALELRGHLAAATRVLLTSAQSASHADRGFLLTQVAELDRRDGRVGAAATHLRQALRESPGYVPALVSRARLAVAQDRPALAERRWRAVVARLPLPEYVTELGELLLQQGHRTAAHQQFAVVRTTVRLLEANGVDTDLETALFEADHGSPAAALAQARAEWGRRHSIHVADALAWALHVNGRDRRALGYAEKATRLGTQEFRLWLHRGLVEAALGKDAAASAHLRRALMADPGASPWQQARARQALAAIREGGRR